MFNRRTFISGTALATTTLVALSACGSKGPETLTETPSGHPVQGETLKYDPNHLVNDGEPITLEWWLWDGDTIFQKFVDEYTAIHKNVEIKIVKQPWEDYWTKLPLSLKDGDKPAIFNIHNSYHSNIFPYLEPYDIPAEELAADYTGAEAHVIDGKIYYVDFGMMTGVIYYNTDHWKEAGLTDADIPETWDELREVAKKLVKKNGDTIERAGFNFNSQFNAFSPGLPYQRGQNLFADDQKTPTVASDAMMELIELFTSFYDVDGVGSKDFGTSSGESFGQQQSSMIYSWTHHGGLMAADFPDVNYDTFRTPVHVSGETPYAFDRYNGESTLGINKAADEKTKAVAQDFLKFYLTSKEALKAVCLNYHVFPSYKPLAEDPEILDDPQLSSLADGIDRYIWPGAMPATIEENLKTMWEDVLYNGADPATAMGAAQEAIEKDLANSDFEAVENLYAHYQPSK